MAADQMSPKVFDRELIRRRRAKMGDDHFLLARCADDCADRLLDVNRKFENALILGNPQFVRRLTEQLPRDKIKALTLADFSDALPDGVMFADEEALPFLFGGATLTELRQSLYGSEEALYGGITPRVSPMVDFQQGAALLQRAGFALPVVDTDKVTVSYSNPMRLFTDLKAMAETNALTARSSKPVSKRFLTKTAQIYADQFSNADGKAVASFEILWLTGWAKHPDQQKPLKPGSAKTRLADALGVKETKL